MEPETTVSESPVQHVKKPKLSWLGLLLSATAGVFCLAMFIIPFFAYEASFPAAYIGYSDGYSFLEELWPFLTFGGAAAGALIYYAGSMIRSSPSIFRRVLYVLILAFGIMVWIATCMFLTVFIWTAAVG